MGWNSIDIITKNNLFPLANIQSYPNKQFQILLDIPRISWYNKYEVISMEHTVKTNIGEMPIEDYRDIKASQLGFEDYDDMYSQGYRLGDEYDYKEGEANDH